MAGDDFQVIEAPIKQKREYPIDPFGGAPFLEEDVPLTFDPDDYPVI